MLIIHKFICLEYTTRRTSLAITVSMKKTVCAAVSSFKLFENVSFEMSFCDNLQH